MYLPTDCGNGSDNFAQFQFVEDCSLSSGIETNHQNSHLLLPPKFIEQFGECETHVGGCVVYLGMEEIV